ncbi:MAG: 2-oxoglutarate oxidoreductase [Sedimentisphaerales bacterium]|nr:2-oxoglutarate oxidoreductase [Sedimentisphaerales bacterium]
MKTVFARTAVLKDCSTHYCPGCGHGIAHRLVAEAIDELGIQGRTIGIAPVGCSVLLYDYIDVDCIEVAHGRAPAVATGMKRTNPDKIVFSYQGDGDLASIGAAEILHAGHRGEQLTVIFINNAVYGMTGGQMAPTTMLNQVTTTSPKGRSAVEQGYPLQVSEVMAVLPGVVYVERTALDGGAGVRKTKKAIKHAFELQVEGAPGLALVEVLSPCPTYWRMPPAKAMKRIREEMSKFFPVGRLKG